MRYLLFLLLFLPVVSFSQKTVDVSKNDVNPVRDGLFYVVGGVPFSSAKYVKVVSGSPYYSEEWMKADLLVAGGERKNVPVKIDLLSGELIYKDSIENELIATTPIRQATIKDPASGENIVLINSASINVTGKEVPAGWYQLLEAGNTSLYKKIHKTITETKPFNSATTEQTIHTINKYFLAANNAFTEIKKVKEIPSVLSDKSKELETFISSNKINGKDDASFSSVIVYYNSLLSK